ncbi:MAG TPA: 16S rRNA (guanine(966)-N(2))-methyltransferase RsmD [Limnochordales bacterium]
MRVVAGQARGRRLHVPRLPGLRPTSDRVRQALMDILRPWLEGCSWLDLFAGCGAVGIEALSRGARRAVFVERHPVACRAVLANLQATGLQERAVLRCEPVEQALDLLARQGERFDVIFADPPYDQLESLARWDGRVLAELLEGRGVVALEHSARHSPPGWQSLRRVRESRYGESAVSFYVREQEPSPWP